MSRSNSERRLRVFPALALVWALPAAAPARAALRLEVVRGEGTNNNAAQGIVTSPAVRALDGNGRPVSGVLVVFSPPRTGPSVAFAGFDSDASVVTDDNGVATAPRVRAVGGNGPVEIRVVASRAGEFASCRIHEMNLGVAGAVAPPAELTVVRVRQTAGRAAAIRVRVEDSAGRPVPHARVLFVLRRVRGGRTDEVARLAGTTGVDGEASGADGRKLGGGRWEFMVRAEAGGQRATRYFSLP